MAEKKLRIHNLANELLVDSKVIIEKCIREGIEVKNHMHVVSAGLAETIRTWFSDGAHDSTLEEASRVDLGKVRKKRAPAKRKAETIGDDQESSSDTAVAVAEPPTTRGESGPAEHAVAEIQLPEPPMPDESPVIEPPADDARHEAPALPDQMTIEPPAVAASLAQSTTPAGERKAAPEITPLQPAAKHADAKPPSIEEPPKRSLAGPQNVPTPAQLSGPRIVRIEKADVLQPPRPAYRPPRGPLPAQGDADEDAERRRSRSPAARRPGHTAASEAAERRAKVKPALKDERAQVLEKLKEWRDRDLIERRDRIAQASGRGIDGMRAIEGKQGSRRSTTATKPTQPSARKNQVELSEPITIRDFSRETGITVSDIVSKLMQEHGVMAGANSGLETHLAELIAGENGIELTIVKAKTGMEKLEEEYLALPRNNLQTRPPVVTVLGHVDHGKTSLLDRIRQTKVAAGEAGGITQHIGAYRVQVGDKWVTFLDTPGHTAFTAMRARGANLTDVVVLVVAADDGVMPTTVEAINHAKAAKATIVVALNKIDLPHDINKIYGQLAEQGLSPAEWGGETDVVKTSAISGLGVDELLNHLATLSEVLDLKADPTLPAAGLVIEAQRSGSLGNVARVLVQEGTLSKGDSIVCGTAHGRIRMLRDDRGKALKSAGPSTPVELTGLSDVPGSGDRMIVVASAQRAKEIAEEAAIRRRERELIREAKPMTLEAVLAQRAGGEIPELNLILRADVQGSIDALKQELSSLPTEKVKLIILHSGVGTVTESDIVLAQASGAIIIAFYVVPEPAIARMADQSGVNIRSYKVIYNATDDIRKALEGLLAPEKKLEMRGRAEVREIFNITRVGKVAGCIIRDGLVQRNHKVRVLRDGVIVRDESSLESLRRFKDDVKEVKNGFECGIRVAGFDDIKPGDIIESFEVTHVAQSL